MEDKIRYRAAAAFIGVPLSTLYSMVCRKQIPHIRLGGRLVVFSRAELETWMNERRVSPAAPEPARV